MPNTPILSILDLRGGQNDTDSPIGLATNEVTDNRNIDWSKGQIGHKRAGTAAVSLSGSVFTTVPPQPEVTTKSGGNNVSSVSFTHGAAAATTNRHLIVTVMMVPVRTITAITYNSVAMTLETSQDDTGTTFNVSRYFGTITDAAAHTIAITFSGTCDAAVTAVTWKNVSAVGTAGSANNAADGDPTRIRTASPAAAFTSPAEVVDSAFSAYATPTPPGNLAAGPGQIVYANHANDYDQARLLQSYEIGRPHTIDPTTTRIQYVADNISRSVTVWSRMTGPAVASNGQVAIVWLGRHTPTDDTTNDELWAIDEFGRIDRRVSGVWVGGVPVMNKWIGAFDTGVTRYYINGASLHGKFFLTMRSAPSGYAGDGDYVPGPGSTSTHATRTWYKDRLLVWDGTTLRHVGLEGPIIDQVGTSVSTPTVANTGAGAYTGTRYFRYRYVEQDSVGVVLRRSEPSSVVTFAPSGAGSGALITRESARLWYDQGYAEFDHGFAAGDVLVKPFEGETHWEVEEGVASATGDFYRIATVAIGTSTYTDTLTTAQVTTQGTLSEALGEYVPIPSARHVVVDDDRLMVGGTKFSHAVTGVIPTTDSRVSWTPVEDDDGVGNDERVPSTILSFIGLDGTDGGNIRAMVAGEHGVVHVFKRNRFYRLLRTGNVASAYDSIMESRVHGALMNCATPGYDAAGNVSVYAVDPTVGLYRLGTSGTEILMDRKVRVTWRTRNKAVDPVRLLYYHDLGQVWTWAALSAATVPDRIFVYDRRLSAFSFHDGNLAAILSATNFPDSTGELRPTLGSSRVNAIQTADSGVSDDGTYFRAYVTTRPFLVGNLIEQFGVLSPPGAFVHALAMGVAAQAITSITRSGTTATVTTTAAHGFSTGDYITIADAVPTDYNGLYEITSTGASTFTYTVAGSPATPATTPGTAQKVTTINVKAIRDSGLESTSFTTSLNPTASETYVTKKIDDFAMSECRTIALEIGDPPSYTLAKLAQTWTVDAVVVQFTVGGA